MLEEVEVTTLRNGAEIVVAVERVATKAGPVV